VIYRPSKEEDDRRFFSQAVQAAELYIWDAGLAVDMNTFARAVTKHRDAMITARRRNFVKIKREMRKRRHGFDFERADALFEAFGRRIYERFIRPEISKR
jgi:hypothetical protein